MAKSKISKITKDLDKIMSDAEKQRKHNQCECAHQLDGRPTLEKYKKNENGNEIHAYRCTQCKKIVSMNVPSAAEVEDAYKVIDTALDYMKIAARLRNEKQEKLAGKVIQLQKIGLVAVPAYASILRSKEEASKNRRNNNNTRRRAFFNT